jgi:hypothetical protein
MVCLPLDLYGPIIDYLDSKNDLLSLTQVSNPFQQESERFLYQGVMVRDGPTLATFCKAICASSRRADHVLSLCISIHYVDFDDGVVDIILLSQAFAQITRLLHLTLLMPLNSLPSSIFETSQFQLYSLTSNDCVEDQGLLRFLET